MNSMHPLTVGPARFTVIAPTCMRMEWQPSGDFIDDGTLFVAARPAPWPDARIDCDGRRVRIDTGILLLDWEDDGQPFHAGNLSVRIRHEGVDSTWLPGMADPANLGGTLPTLDGVDRARDMGDGLLSASGWGFIDDSLTHLLIDGWVAPRPPGGIDWYLFGYGHDFRAALAVLAHLSGGFALPRKCTLGAWYSRWWKYTADDYRAIVAGYREHGFGLDVLVFDMDWHTQDDATSGFGWAWTKGWTGWTWNRQLVPDAEALLAELKAGGLAITLNAHPHDGVRHHEACYGEFMRLLGRDPASGEDVPFRAGDRDYMRAYFAAAHEPHERAGVDFWWVDWQQDQHVPEVIPVPGLSHLRWLNQCYYRHAARDGRRGLSFSRWGGWGDHRHPIHFSGDITALWATLAYEVGFTSTAVGVGCCYWSHDIGGFCGRRDEELYARWAQFGATSAALRMHSATEDLDRRPWLWESDIVASLRHAFIWRARLMPALYSAMHRTWREQVPFLRPLWFDHPGWGEAWRNPQVYLLGDHLVCAPVTTPGQGPRRLAAQLVALPPGEWAHLQTDERLPGGCHVVCADLEEWPIFVRTGAPVILAPRPDGPAPLARSLVQPVVRVHLPVSDGRWSTTLIEDDGVSDAYRGGATASREITVERCGAELRLRIAAGVGHHDGPLQRRRWRLEAIGTSRCTAGSVEDGVACIDLGELEECRGYDFSFRIAAADPAVAEGCALGRRLGALSGVIDTDPTAAWALLAASGIVVLPLQEGPRVSGPGTLHLVHTPGTLDADRIQVTVIDEVDGECTLRDLGTWGAGRIPLPAVPELAAPAPDRWARRQVELRGTIAGRPVVARSEIDRRQGSKP